MLFSVVLLSIAGYYYVNRIHELDKFARNQVNAFAQACTNAANKPDDTEHAQKHVRTVPTPVKE
jgi:hypothetical protein